MSFSQTESGEWENSVGALHSSAALVACHPALALGLDFELLMSARQSGKHILVLRISQTRSRPPLRAKCRGAAPSEARIAHQASWILAEQRWRCSRSDARSERRLISELPAASEKGPRHAPSATRRQAISMTALSGRVIRVRCHRLALRWQLCNRGLRSPADTRSGIVHNSGTRHHVGSRFPLWRDVASNVRS